MALADLYKRAKMWVKNESGEKVYYYPQTKLSSIVDSPIKSLTRKTTYAINDVCSVETMDKPGYLICTMAGITGASEPSFVGKEDGDEVTDGTAVFKVLYVDSVAGLKKLFTEWEIDDETLVIPAVLCSVTGETLTLTKS